MVELPGRPMAPVVPAAQLARSLSGVVDHATAVVTLVVMNPRLLDELPPSLRGRLTSLCDAVFDLDHRAAPLGERSGGRRPGD